MAISQALRAALEDAAGVREREGVRRACEAIGRLFEANSRAFDYDLWLRNCGLV